VLTDHKNATVMVSSSSVGSTSLLVNVATQRINPKRTHSGILNTNFFQFEFCFKHTPRYCIALAFSTVVLAIDAFDGRMSFQGPTTMKHLGRLKPFLVQLTTYMKSCDTTKLMMIILAVMSPQYDELADEMAASVLTFFFSSRSYCRPQVERVGRS
jgi:hypothetical protein